MRLESLGAPALMLWPASAPSLIPSEPHFSRDVRRLEWPPASTVTRRSRARIPLLPRALLLCRPQSRPTSPIRPQRGEDSFISIPLDIVQGGTGSSFEGDDAAPEASRLVKFATLRAYRCETGEAIRGLHVVLELESDLDAFPVEPCGLTHILVAREPGRRTREVSPPGPTSRAVEVGPRGPRPDNHRSAARRLSCSGWS